MEWSNADAAWARAALRALLLQIAIDCEHVARRLRWWTR